ncbi:post-PEP-CTERM-1 domain-containing protein [Arenimonas terrae]|uniref:post-PEP-CTERM-1 domain-containing protein n=1 Tax=Arenimonas terrae TaxID=2546226 RepID=UPI00159EEC97|nr:hypothetical protein [Arenimonas terrae]
MQMSALKPLAVPLALALTLSVPAFAADTASSEPGSKTGIDRETGRLRATTAAEDRELERDAERLRQSARAKAGPGVGGLLRPATEAEAQQTLVRHADGSVSMLVPESLDSQVLVTRDAQGQLVVSHAGDVEVDHVEE